MREGYQTTRLVEAELPVPSPRAVVAWIAGGDLAGGGDAKTGRGCEPDPFKPDSNPLSVDFSPVTLKSDPLSLV
jgi:hypothetical protein